MARVVRYRYRVDTEDPWSVWYEYSGKDHVYFPRGAYVEMCTGHALRAGSIYKGRFDTIYTIVDGIRHAENFAGSSDEHVACKVTYENGEYTFAFIATKELESMKEMD